MATRDLGEWTRRAGPAGKRTISTRPAGVLIAVDRASLLALDRWQRSAGMFDICCFALAQLWMVELSTPG